MTFEKGVSLLWPDDVTQPAANHNEGYSMADLTLENIIRRLSLDTRYERYVRTVLNSPSHDVRVLEYRQAVIEDLLRSAGLTAGMEKVLHSIVTLERYLNEPQWQESELRKVAWRLSELENYVECIDLLNALFEEAGDNVRSTALCRLRAMVQSIAQDELFSALRTELPHLLAQVRGIKSISIGVNLDGQLRPIEATLLTVNTERFRGDSSSLLSRIFGQNPVREDNEGIGPLHRAKYDNSGLFSAR